MAIFGVRKAIKKNIKSLMGLETSNQSTVPSWTPPEPPRRPVEPPQPEEVQAAPEEVHVEPVPATKEIEMPKDDVVLQEPLSIHTDDEGQPLTLENVEEVIDDFIRPGVQADGGNIELLKIENNDVYVKLTGACQSCSSAIMTMKMGVEALLREEFPSMRQLIDETIYAA
jgi:Fe-S cluster biogenesis protein NfuA